MKSYYVGNTYLLKQEENSMHQKLFSDFVCNLPDIVSHRTMEKVSTGPYMFSYYLNL
jgi:hypothetical protein